MSNKIMKTLIAGDNKYEIYDDFARTSIKNNNTAINILEDKVTLLQSNVNGIKIPKRLSDLEDDSNFISDNDIKDLLSSVSINPSDIASLYITSKELLNLKSKASGEVLAKVEVRLNNGEIIHCYANMKIQGSSSSSKPKKNYTIKFYSDKRCSKKLKIDVGWGKEYKYCFKANYVDTTHTRNLTGAKLAYDMVESRPDSEFKTALQTHAPRNGAVDGFPVVVYLNDEFHGLYTWNIPKDPWMFGMDDENPNHFLVVDAYNNNQDMTATDPGQFRSEWNPETSESWEIECGEDVNKVAETLNRFIRFVMTATDKAFHDNFSDYADLYSFLDYYIFSDLCCHLDGLGNNLLMAAYDGVHWGASLYDMDTIFGAWWTGESFVATDYACPEAYQENNSLIWQRIWTCFPYELKERYFELRNGALSLGNMISHVEKLFYSVPERLFLEEQVKWTALPSVAENTIDRFKTYMRERAAIIDAKYNAITYNIPCDSVILKTGSLVFTNDDIQEVDFEIMPINTSDKIEWYTEPAGLCDVINGNRVVPLKNGSGMLILSCGSYIESCEISISGVNNKLNYIQSDGTNAINTEYVPKYYTDIEASFNVHYDANDFKYNHFISSDNMMKIQWNGSSKFCLWRQGLQYQLNAELDAALQNTDVVLRFYGDLDTGAIVNGQEIDLGNSKYGTLLTTTEQPILIFSGYDGANEEINYREAFKFYYLKIEEFGEVIHYFIPILDSSNTPCVYDVIDKTYHYNTAENGNAFTYA